MIEGVQIEVKYNNTDKWIYVTVPYVSLNKKATLQNEAGSVIQSIQLTEGTNTININKVTADPLFLKIETEFETIVKKIQKGCRADV